MAAVIYFSCLKNWVAVILSVAKDLTQWFKILRYAQDDNRGNKDKASCRINRTLQSFITVFFMGLASSAHAQDTVRLHEKEIKAALLYNFLKYTDWPETGMDKSSPFQVCVFGEDPFDGSLHAMAARTVNQHKIILSYIESIPETGTCHLLYVNEQKKDRWPELLKFISGKSILTISDYSGFAESGGIIEFGHQKEHIHAWLNMEALADAQLHVQDRLLKLVSVIDTGSSKGNE